MMVVDASVWVSWLLATDSRHAISVRWVNAKIAQGEVLYMPSLAITEVGGAVARQSGRSVFGRRSARRLFRLPNLRIVPVDNSLALRAAMLAADLMLKGADAPYVAIAYKMGIPLVTWDNEQASRASALVATLQPHA